MKLKFSKKDKRMYFVAAILLLIFFHWVGLLKPLESFFISLIKPIGRNIYYVDKYFKEEADQNLDINELNNLLKEKEKENTKLLSEVSRLKIFEEENIKLRKIKDLSEESGYKLITSRILFNGLNGTENYFFGKKLIIDKGSKDGLFPGLALVNEDGVVIGKILNVKDNLSEGCLITEENCRLAVTLQNKNKTIGVAQGSLGLTAKINFIPQTEDVKEDEMIITSGIESDVPMGMLLGTVDKIEKNNNDVWQSVLVKTLFNPNDLTIVSAVLPEKNF